MFMIECGSSLRSLSFAAVEGASDTTTFFNDRPPRISDNNPVPSPAIGCGCGGICPPDGTRMIGKPDDIGGAGGPIAPIAGGGATDVDEPTKSNVPKSSLAATADGVAIDAAFRAASIL